MNSALNYNPYVSGSISGLNMSILTSMGLYSMTDLLSIIRDGLYAELVPFYPGMNRFGVYAISIMRDKQALPDLLISVSSHGVICPVGQLDTMDIPLDDPNLISILCRRIDDCLTLVPV